MNGAASIPDGALQLERTGALANFRNAPGEGGVHRGEVNQDAEVYKWIEAASYELAHSGDEKLRDDLREVVAAVARAQRRDGYLHTWRQLSGVGPPFSGLRTGHADETYTAGHLIAAAIAMARAVGDESLVPVAVRLADHIRAVLVGDDPDAVPGHPGIEMALVELYRLTGEERHLALAKRFIDNRGKSHLGSHRFGSSHYQDYLPILDAPALTGHAVAALYLACGATDVAVETGDKDLLAALERQWQAVASRKTYITGGLGSTSQM